MVIRNPSQNLNPNIVYFFTILNNKHIETKLRKKNPIKIMFLEIYKIILIQYILGHCCILINSYMVGLKDDFKINLVYNYLEEVKIRGVLYSNLLGGAVRG